METLSRKQQSKYNRLVKDLHIFKKSAQKTGKTLERYLTDLNLEPEIAAKIAIKAQEIKEVAKDHKNTPKPLSETKNYVFKSKPEAKMKDTIKERLLDVIKWGIIIIFISIAFYILYPKYYFTGPKGHIWYRCNSVNGQVEYWDRTTKSWIMRENQQER